MNQNVIILQGEADAGKTTTSGFIYQELIKHTTQSHTFDGNEVIVDSLRIINNETQDFIAIIYINGYKIVIISAGDIYDKLEKAIDAIGDFDVLIVCARTRNSTTYSELQQRFKEKNSEIFTFPVIRGIRAETIKEDKQGVVNNVVNKVLELTNQ